MERNPSGENADDEATNETHEPNPEETENDILSEALEETVLPPEDDGSSSDKNVINDSEPEAECPPDAVSEADGEPTVENVADVQEQAPEEKEPEEPADDEASPEEIVPDADVEEDLHDEPLLQETEQEEEIAENVEKEEQEVQEEQEEPEQEASSSEREAEEQLLDEKEVAESIIEYIDEKVLSSEKELAATDSGQLGILAAGIVTTIIKSSIVPSATELTSREPGEEMDLVAEDREDVEPAEVTEVTEVTEGAEVVEVAEVAEVAEADAVVAEAEVPELALAEDEIFPTPRRVKMLDKAVQAIAREIDEALEALSEESLPSEEAGEVENIESVESCVVSEGEPYQTCEDASDADEAEDLPCGEGSGLVPCSYMEEETAEEEEGLAVDTEDESQWEDLGDDGEETVLVSIDDAQLSDKQEGFELRDASEISVPREASIPSELQDSNQPIEQDEEFPQEDTYTPIAPDEECASGIQNDLYAPIAQDEEVAPAALSDTYTPIAQVEEYAPSAPAETYTPSAPQADTAPARAQDRVTPPPSTAPTPVRRRESTDGTRPAPPPPDAFKPRAVASDTQRRAAAQSAVTPKREAREECEWQQAIRDLKDQFLDSPYDYILKFVLLCVAIRTVRNIVDLTKCG